MAIFCVKSGTMVRVTANIRDVAGALSDPSSVTITVLKTDGTTASYTGGQLTHPSTGVYYVDVLHDQAGDWWVKVVTTGVPTVVEEAPVNVLGLQVP